MHQEIIKTLNLHEKINLAMSELDFIPKDGWNLDKEYLYVKEQKVNNAIKPLLSKYRIGFVMMSATEVPINYKIDPNDLNKYHVAMKCEFKVINIDNVDEYFFLSVTGHAADNKDKAGYTAITGARKYALMQLFLVSASDDPEAKPENIKQTDKPQPKSWPAKRKPQDVAPLNEFNKKLVGAIPQDEKVADVDAKKQKETPDGTKRAK